jgi:hypothetical protein
VLADFLLEYPAISVEVSADSAKSEMVQGRFDAGSCLHIHSSLSLSVREVPKDADAPHGR